ncbi:MAG TPA: hypothetical protein VH475_15075 [Tepidisphaeraceae bacterium]|jgi:hypothetical protein
MPYDPSVRRYPPSFPHRPPARLEYETRPGGIRRRPHPVWFPIALIVAVGVLAVCVPYLVAFVVVYVRGMGQD